MFFSVSVCAGLDRAISGGSQHPASRPLAQYIGQYLVSLCNRAAGDGGVLSAVVDTGALNWLLCAMRTHESIAKVQVTRFVIALSFAAS